MASLSSLARCDRAPDATAAASSACILRSSLSAFGRLLGLSVPSFLPSDSIFTPLGCPFLAPFEAELEADAVCALLLSAPLILLSPVPLCVCSPKRTPSSRRYSVDGNPSPVFSVKSQLCPAKGGEARPNGATPRVSRREPERPPGNDG